MSKRLRIPVYFLVTGLLWGLISDPVITLFFGHLNSVQQDTFRSLNDFAFVIIISIVLYIEIGNQQKKISESEEQYRDLFESNPNPMWIYDTYTFAFIKVNDAAVAKYGYSHKQFLSMSVLDIRHERDHPKVEKYVNDPTRLKNSGVWEHIKANGESMMVTIISHVVMFENKKCRMVLVTDLTDIIDKEKKLQEANDKLKTNHEVLLDINWSNSHELRKPLCSMLSLVDLLKDATNEQEKKEYIALLQQCTQEMDEITQKNNAKLNAISVF
jgi:PAS domain S-box-containing protein